MQRPRSGDRQPPRGGGADLGKGIMKVMQYPTMGIVMELMRKALRINITNESRVEGNRSTLLKLTRSSVRQSAQPAQNLTLCGTSIVAACLRGT